MPNTKAHFYKLNFNHENKNTQSLIDASKEVGLEVNVEKTKYMLVSQDQNAGQNREIEIGNRSFENVSQFNDSNKSKFDSGGNQEEIEFW
jgi:hypothetical protein